MPGLLQQVRPKSSRHAKDEGDEVVNMQTTTALRLYGKRDLRLETFELPAMQDDEILARVVTDSLCLLLERGQPGRGPQKGAGRCGDQPDHYRP
jgi:hypothetical protein